MSHIQYINPYHIAYYPCAATTECPMYSAEDLELQGHPLLCVFWGEDFSGHSAFKHHAASLLQSTFGAKGCISNSLPYSQATLQLKFPVWYVLV